jgi:hypothetical protein
MILKEMLKHESLCKILLYSDQYVPYRSPSDMLTIHQILYFPALHRDNHFRHLMRCVRQPQGDVDTSQTDGSGLP